MEPITLLALAGTAYYLSRKKKPTGFPMQQVLGRKTGKTWLTRVVSIVGSGDSKLTTVQVFTPKNSYGPHVEHLVVTYQQTGSDKSARRSIAVNPHALPIMVTDAGKDFGIKKA